MPNTFFIADTHFGHRNIINLDNRPFKDTQEMEETMRARWNARVTADDLVYILGDFCWSKDENEWIRILDSLNGAKYLIKGNHDSDNMSKTLIDRFIGVSDYKEIRECHTKIILCHYPILAYNNSFKENTYMIHGHVHNSTQEHIMVERMKRKIWKSKQYNAQGNIINCGCMMDYMEYKPHTIGELAFVLEEQKKER